MAVTIAGFGDGFAKGYGIMSNVMRDEEASKRADAHNKRLQESHDFDMNRKKELEAEGAKLTDLVNSSMKDVNAAQYGVAAIPAQEVAGTGEGYMTAPVAAQKPVSIAEQQKIADKYASQINAQMVRIFSKSDPAKAGEYATKLASEPMQRYTRDAMLASRLFAADPGSAEARDAVATFYDHKKDGFKLNKDAWSVNPDGSVATEVIGEDGTVKPINLSKEHMRAYAHLALSPAEYANVLHQNDTLGVTRDHYKATEGIQRDTLAATTDYHNKSLANQEREWKARLEEMKAAREDRKAARTEREEDRKEARTAREKDAIFSGVEVAFVGDKKTFPDLPPEEKNKRLAGINDTLNLIDDNPSNFEGKSARVGANAASVVNAFSAGQGELLGFDKNNPDMAVMRLGTREYRVPKDSQTMALFRDSAQKRQTAPAKQTAKPGVAPPPGPPAAATTAGMGGGYGLAVQ
jgi:hypothetical protein